jgi:hypothetical protein
MNLSKMNEFLCVVGWFAVLRVHPHNRNRSNE